MSPGLTTRGGAGGVHANVDDMRRTADVLAHAESTFGRVSGQALSHAAAGALLRTAALSPASAFHAEATLGHAAASTGLLVVGVEVQVLLLRARAQLFVIADEGAAAVERIGKVVLTPLVLVGAIVGGAATAVVALGVEVAGIAAGVLTGEIPLSQVDDRLRHLPQDVLADVAGVAARVVSACPQVVDIVTGGLPWWLTPPPVRPFLPNNVEGVIWALQGIAGVGGLVQDRPVRITSTSAGNGQCAEGLRGVLAGVTELEQRYGQDRPHYRSGVRITKVDGVPPRWIVEIPGTTDWNPSAGEDPSDLTTNVQLMQRRGELLAAIRQAMHEAGIAPGDPVMVAGHSQGGIAAAALASDRTARSEFHITNVLTSGSPVADMPIPHDIHVLSIEHTQDPVPRLEGHENPDSANWTTVTLDVSNRPGVATNPIAAHSGGLYTQTAGMIDSDPALASDISSFKAFTGGSGVSTDYEFQRG